MTQIVVDAEKYSQLLEKLVRQVVDRQPHPQLVVGIIRGGFYPADLLARVLGVPWSYLYVQSYGDERAPGEIRLGRELIGAKPERGQRVLIVDDLVDSGKTLVKTQEWFEVHFPDYDLQLRTAVIWKKASTLVDPDFFVENVPFIAGTQKCPWIVQAHEQEADRIRQQLGLEPATGEA